MISDIMVKFLRSMKVAAMATFIATSLQCYAQQVEVLGERHAMVRLDAARKYLLLPIDESEEMAHVRVVCNNRLITTFNCRLSTGKVDYFMPYEIGEGGLFDITFNGNPRHAAAIAEFACWKRMRYVDTLDMRNKEVYRPLYHHTPTYGWMNDPNGMFYKDGEWHLYYQWNPYGSQWENMTWGHSVSRDLVHWTPMPTALEADGLGTIFSGSAVVDKNNTAGFGAGAIVAFYTSAGPSQTQSMAYSTDNGKTFTKYEGNPILTSAARDFRDPHVFWNEEKGFWNLILAAGQEMQIYSSADLKKWKYESSFGNGYGNHGGVWECPDLMKMKVDGTGEEKWMLICNINPGGPWGGSATQYFTGSFDGKVFQCDSKPDVTKWMDYGKDHYATVTFDNAPEGRHTAIAWMSNWEYANQVPTKQFRSANSVPRDLGLFAYKGETYCKVLPAKEMDALRGEKLRHLEPACEMVVTLNGSATLTLRNGKGESVVMRYDAEGETFEMDRRRSGEVSFSDAFPAVTTAPTYGKIRQLRVFIDNSSIEVFDVDGKMAMTNLVFPSEPYQTVDAKGKAKTAIYVLNYRN